MKKLAAFASFALLSAGLLAIAAAPAGAALSGASTIGFSFRSGPFPLANMTTAGRNFTLMPGQSVVVTVVVRQLSGAQAGDTRLATLTAKSLGQANGAKSDLVKIRGTKA